MATARMRAWLGPVEGSDGLQAEDAAAEAEGDAAEVEGGQGGQRDVTEQHTEGTEGILDLGDRVTISGLAKKSELNGQIAVVKDFKAGDGEEAGRVMIELEESKTCG